MLNQDCRINWSLLVKNNHQSCFNFFEEIIPRYPNALAIWSRERTYTWQETQDRVYQYAAYFLKLGIRPGQLVAFYLKNAPEYMIAWLGLWAIGRWLV
jgi:acyl-CoA synthetase (AMP-forming)/AMP-acid ligase II